MNEEDWVRIIDYSDYLCRSWQTLYFKQVVARFIKITGVRNTANRIFHLVSMEVRFTLDRYDLINGFIGKFSCSILLKLKFSFIWENQR